MVWGKKILTPDVDPRVFAGMPLQAAVQADIRWHSIGREGTYVIRSAC
jgi:hypothetical protein